MFWWKSDRKSVSKPSENLTEIIYRIKDGDKELREKIINDYTPFILSCVSKHINKYVEVENSEEFSIGLLAFNKAIDDYDKIRGQSFLNFAELVIKRRLLNYLKKENRNNHIYPFSYFEGENNLAFEDSFTEDSMVLHFDNFETREEITIFNDRLGQFGITLDELIKKTPKHKDSKQMLIQVAKIIADNDNLYNKLNTKMNIPMTELTRYITIKPKTVEKNRKYIIAACIAFRSDLDIIKGFLQIHLEGR